MGITVNTYIRAVVLWLLPSVLLLTVNDPVTAWTHSQSLLPLHPIRGTRTSTTTTATATSSCLFLASRSDSGNTQKQLIPRSVTNLERWAERVGIQKSPALRLDQDPASGYGWTATTDIAANQVLLQVPTDMALTVTCPGDGPNDTRVLRRCSDRKAFREGLPWYAQFSAYLHVLKKEGNNGSIDDKSSSSSNRDVQAWLESLPRSLDTPLHWKTDNIDDAMSELQYDFMTKAVSKQRDAWQRYHKALQANGFDDLSYDDFVWGCEMARSRAFSGAYTGGAFNPGIYAFTLALVAIYIGLGLGTTEQAANGAGVVFCVTVLKDFVFPKLFKSKKYVICPLIDMANHQSVGYVGDVSFEYFANAYSLSTTSAVKAGQALCINYGARSNDQWLQYYGFIEPNNPHDVYIMLPLREWPLNDMEVAAGRSVAAGRLQALERAGLLGYTYPDEISNNGADNDNGQIFDENAANADGGVVITRDVGLDPAVWQALRALFCTDAEWQAAGESVGSFAESSPSAATERAVRNAAKCALEWELSRKATTLEQDITLQQRQSNSKAVDMSTAETLVLAFRIEKKKLLQECLKMIA